MEQTRADGYCISDDPVRLDRTQVWRWLSEESYWAAGRAPEVQDRAIEHSLCFGAYAPDGRQVGFCRFVTDRATFAFLSDVFVDVGHRANGVGSFLVGVALEHPDVATVRRHALITRDAHGVYERFGYTALTEGERPLWMIRTPAG